MDNSGPGGRPRILPDVHPSAQQYIGRLAKRKINYSLRCSVEGGDQGVIADSSSGLVSNTNRVDSILRLGLLALEDENGPIQLPRKSQIHKLQPKL